MKKSLFFLIALCIISVIQSHAQVAINTDSSAADPSAILDLKSSNKGLLLPRVKDISTNPITNPKAGLIVFDSATNKNWIYNLYGWEPQTPFNLPFSGSYSSITTPLVIENHGGHAISALSYGAFTSAGYFYGDSGALSLQMRGPFQVFDNGEGAGKVLTSDASGIATWQNPSGGLTLPYSASGSSAASPALSISNTSTTGNAIGLYGSTSSASGGASATSGVTAVEGEVLPTSGGGYSAGVRGINRSTTGLGIGVIGYQAGSGWGVYGESPSGIAVNAYSSGSAYGVYSRTTSGTAGYFTSTSGLSLNTGIGNVLIQQSLTVNNATAGNSNNGINAYSTNGIGVYASSTASNGGAVLAEGAYIGVQGTATGTNSNRQAIRGDNNGASDGYAGVFVGNLAVFGTLSKSAGSFQIDHPLDPEHKYLVHSFVESPDMMNIYNGIATTNGKGEIEITMPDWFDALNMDFRYQLTCINQFAQAIISKEMSGNRFTIKTDKPNVKVSWQVTGIRNDPYARDHRLPVEKNKTGDEVGRYVYPQGYGRGIERSIANIVKEVKERKN